MESEEEIPGDWMVETERTTYDEVMDRDYTTVLYRQELTRSAVYINEVIDGENLWKYSVHHSGRDGELGTAADLETAKQMAFAFMNESVDSV